MKLRILPMLAFVVGTLVCSSRALSKPVEEGWPREDTKACLDQRLGGEQRAAGEGTGGLALALTVLGKCGGSHQVLAGRTHRGTWLEMASAYDLREQLERVRARNPSTSFADACSSAKVRRRTFGEEKRKLRTLLERLDAVRIAPAMQSPMVIHGALYEIWIYSVVGMSHYAYQVADSEGPVDELQSWVEELLVLAGLDCSD